MSIDIGDESDNSAIRVVVKLFNSLNQANNTV